MLLFFSSKGTTVSIRGIQNTPQHVEVPYKDCKDVGNGLYPSGLICSGDQGNVLRF